MHVIKRLRRPYVRHRKNEKGATLVVVALLMVALLGMAAISIDFAVASSDKSAAQNAADAAALAIARQCAIDPSNCNDAKSTSEMEWVIDQNAPGKSGLYSPAPAASANKRVTVTVEGARQALFAQIFDDSELEVGAQATATWDQSAVYGTPNIPIGFGYCDWRDRQGTIGNPGTSYTYPFVGGYNSHTRSCTGVPNDPTKSISHPGSRGIWFVPDGLPGIDFSNCRFSASVWDVYSDIINFSDLNIHFGCDGVFGALAKEQIIMVPIYGIGSWRGPLTGINYPNSVAIIGFAPFKITGFQRRWQIWPFPAITQDRDTCRFPVLNNIFLGLGNCSAIKGQFVRTARPIPGWEYSNTYRGGPAPDLGAIKVTLTD